MKKRLIMLIIIVSFAILLMPLSALAEGEALLTIDNANIYSGMDKAYKDGYLPKIENGCAKIVLPLVTQDLNIKNNTIFVTPNFGDPATSPFVFSNIEQTVQRADNPTNNGAKPSCLVSLSLPLTDGRINGRYPVVIQAKYQKEDGTALEQSFTVYVTITDGKEAASAAPSEKPKPQPKIIIKDYKVSPDPVVAGQEFLLSFVLENTNTKQNVQNIKVMIKGETADLMPAANSNTVWIKSIAKGKMHTIEFRMKVRLDAEPKPQKIQVAVEYEDSKATAITANEEIPVEIKQPNRISFDPPNIKKTMNAGDTETLSIHVYNMGKNKLSNVMFKLDAPGLLPDGSAFVGTLEPGADKTAELSVFIGTKDMSQDDGGQVTTGNDDANKYGFTSGVIKLTYEDEFGQQYSEDIKLETTINPPYIPPKEEEKKEEKPKASQWWISVIIAAAVIGALITAILLIKKKQSKKVQFDEAD